MMTQALPVRKPNRLKGYDYASCGLYFITICTKDRECLLWDNVGAICDRPPVPHSQFRIPHSAFIWRLLP